MPPASSKMLGSQKLSTPPNGSINAATPSVFMPTAKGAAMDQARKSLATPSGAFLCFSVSNATHYTHATTGTIRATRLASKITPSATYLLVARATDGAANAPPKCKAQSTVQLECNFLQVNIQSEIGSRVQRFS